MLCATAELDRIPWGRHLIPQIYTDTVIELAVMSVWIQCGRAIRLDQTVNTGHFARLVTL